MKSVNPGMEVELPDPLEEIKNRCTECGNCVIDCLFLQKHGTPKSIADASSPGSSVISYECSLCGLCSVRCPEGLDPSRMFLKMRQESVDLGNVDLKKYAGILNYEKKGVSKLFTWYSLPENCDTILFPGCSFPGTRPDGLMKLFEHMKKTIPALGIVLDCCTKPSHDLGRMDFFKAHFSEMHRFLTSSGIKKIYVLCPNCYRIFSDYAPELQVKTAYEYLSAERSISRGTCSETLTIHDPCILRNNSVIQQSIRKIAGNRGFTIKEMPHSREKTLCCGEGVSTGLISPDLPRKWREMRKIEAGGMRILAYCAGCTGLLDMVTPASHIIDLYFDPEKTLSGRFKASKAPFTYINRLILKWKIKRNEKAGITRERNPGSIK